MYGVEIFVGEPNAPYVVVGTVECTGNEYADLDDVQQGLIDEARKLGANAIINVDYQRKMTWTSFNSLYGTATAVILEADTMPCPSCAEDIKRAAKKCRFCGELV